ncbi:unnamed protein product [Allacma fusca]|uniref:Flavin-containing monooxygenase n=1 Tax=Allacma fusca TaxID=39272 RepID=A0A8J2KYT1_9HEXA|nr:unnamed protein product [Allacma fusca]
MKVCVIGGGAAGLTALRHLSSSAGITPTLYEQSEHVGGVWGYTDKTGEDERTGDEIHTVMYRDLKTNLPKEIMGFLDFPFHKGKTSFVSHEQVNQYLHEYADHFQLRSSIQFNHRVVHVTPHLAEYDSENNPSPKWLVSVKDLQLGKEEIEEFDSVMVCNGHFCKPFIPDIVNIQVFQGEVLHSRDYRSPEIFANKRVVVLGCGPSGVDISLEIAQVATEVIISFRNPPLESSFPANVRQAFSIKSGKSNGFIFEDNQECDCDVLLLCTGYKYDFPFLDQQCGVIVEKGKQVTPLYKHMIHTKYPTLCFVGIPFHVLPFYLFEVQVRYFVKYLEGNLRLPTESQMNTDLLEDRNLRQRMGLPLSQSHHLGPMQWEYYHFLAQHAGFPLELKPVVRKIYEEAGDRRRLFASFYKNDMVRILDDENYIYDSSSVTLSSQLSLFRSGRELQDHQMTSKVYPGMTWPVKHM